MVFWGLICGADLLFDFALLSVDFRVEILLCIVILVVRLWLITCIWLYTVSLLFVVGCVA